jgi:hypothetical protein
MKSREQIISARIKEYELRLQEEKAARIRRELGLAAMYGEKDDGQLIMLPEPRPESPDIAA